MAGLLIASLSSVGLMGCTDDEIAEAVGDVAVIAGAVLIATTTTCVAGYDQVCHEYRDYNGNFHTECEQTYDSCAVLVPKDNMLAERPSLALASASVAKAPTGDIKRDSLVNEVNWGKTFNISFAASEQFINAMQAAKTQKDTRPLLALGLSLSDLKEVANYDLPSAPGLDALAKNLNISRDSATAMIQKLEDQARVQAQEDVTPGPASFMQ